MLSLYIFVLILIILYNTIIYRYFRLNNTVISYDMFLKHFFHTIDSENYYMNYGLWDAEHTTLHQANVNLVNFIFEKADLIGKKNMAILDVGCGYGHQDIAWAAKLDKSCTIKAVDIAEKQIYYAIQNAIDKKSPVIYDICDALFIDKKYKNEAFDVVFSLESAFHYPDRPKFFKNVKTLLKPTGKFIITDLVLKKSTANHDMKTKLFLKFFSDFLGIPRQNLITPAEWDAQISDEFTIQEIIDTTDETFTPYYTYFMRTFIKNKGLPDSVGQFFANFFCSLQPFAYRIAVCESKSIKV
jgi:cyclopropane fatty-acyl-phospholipid synthase-like methyltransferase